MTLTDFLLARIAEDESTARDVRDQALMGRPFIAITAGGTGVRRLTDPGWWLDGFSVTRQIAELHGSDDGAFCNACTTGWPCETLRHLALPYADHPDYRAEWRP